MARPDQDLGSCAVDAELHDWVREQATARACTQPTITAACAVRLMRRLSKDPQARIPQRRERTSISGISIPADIHNEAKAVCPRYRCDLQDFYDLALREAREAVELGETLQLPKRQIVAREKPAGLAVSKKLEALLAKVAEQRGLSVEDVIERAVTQSAELEKMLFRK